MDLHKQTYYNCLLRQQFIGHVFASGLEFVMCDKNKQCFIYFKGSRCIVLVWYGMHGIKFICHKVSNCLFGI